MYDLTYYENMLTNYSMTAEHINSIRWTLLMTHIKDLHTVLDYGSGVGWFRAFRPDGIQVYTYDVADYPQTGIPDGKDFDCICFWDVLEHLPNFSILNHLLNRTTHIALSMPVMQPETVLSTWKHFKPGEHLNYFTERDVIDLFEYYGFVCTYRGEPECPPRIDIKDFIMRRRTH